MRLLRVLALSLIGLGLLPGLLAAASTEKGAFDAAVRAFQDGFYGRAETEFASFIERFTNSARLPEALLAQAKARLQQTNHSGTIELLTKGLPQAGKIADEYTFWLAEAHSRKGDQAKAAEQFAELLRLFPNSPRRLEAEIGEATARSKLGQWVQVIAVLQQTNGVFGTAARSQTNEFTLRGFLMLAEAEFVQSNYPAARAALQPVLPNSMPPRLAWQWQYMLSRLDDAEGKPGQALLNGTNLLSLATNTAEPSLLAETIAFQAGLLEKANRPDEALDLYERNLADGFPPERQRQALLRIAEISLARNRIGRAATVLERFCSQHTNAPARDLGLLTLGELRLRQHLVEPATNALPVSGTNAPAATNHLQQAMAALVSLTREFPESNLLGKAQLDLGWCYWLDNRFPEAKAAFEAAANRLTSPPDRAVALFKLGDTQLRLNDWNGALTSYTNLLQKFSAELSTLGNLLEPALYQTVRAAIGANNLLEATNNLGRLLAAFPKGFHTERAALLAGQAVTREGNPAGARQISLDFAKAAPGSPLLPEVQLAIARTYEQEQLWLQAISVYDEWLARVTNSPGRPRAEYLRAHANFQAGRETNAIQQFTNFIAQYPTHECKPLAQWWVADFYFRTGRLLEAEENFQLLYQSTNWPQSDLAYQARLMAGRTAVARQGWKDAIGYFTNLTSDVKCPPDIWAQATFAYGSALMSKDSTNKLDKLADYATAINVFNSIYERYPTNKIAVLALGEKAGCLLQWAQNYPQFEAAAIEFQKVITNRLADFTARAIARVGLATVLEQQARQKTGADQALLFRQALDNYLDVFYFDKDLADKETLDLFWVKRAGLEAARVAEALQEWQQAINIYERLNQLLPALRPTLEKKSAKARESLLRTRS